MKKLNQFLHAQREWASLPLRFISGWMLVSGAWSMAFFLKPISGMVDFFEGLDFPFPEFMVYLAIYIQLIGGLLLILGLWVRQAAIILTLYFSIALLAAHMQHPIAISFSAWGLWAMSCSLVLSGNGKLALENQLNRKKSNMISS